MQERVSGVCPGCGAQPALGRLARADGRLTLYCARCGGQWPFPRLVCPFCGAGPGRNSFTLDGDTARRVECCDACKRYLVTIDERVLGAAADPAREASETARLDAAAMEAGYVR